MDDEIDGGPIIYQKSVDIQPSDTSLDVYEKVIEVEKVLISKHLANIVNDDYSFSEASDNGNYNSIADFRSLCNLNLSDVGTLGDHIDLLRALSHGDFNNAYFIANNEKIYVKLILKKW